MKRSLTILAVLAIGRVMMSSVKSQTNQQQISKLTTRIAALENGTGFKAGITLHGTLNCNNNNISNVANIGGGGSNIGVNTGLVMNGGANINLSGQNLNGIGTLNPSGGGFSVGGNINLGGHNLNLQGGKVNN